MTPVAVKDLIKAVLSRPASLLGPVQVRSSRARRSRAGPASTSLRRAAWRSGRFAVSRWGSRDAAGSTRCVADRASTTRNSPVPAARRAHHRDPGSCRPLPVHPLDGGAPRALVRRRAGGDARCSVALASVGRFDVAVLFRVTQQASWLCRLAVTQLYVCRLYRVLER